MAKVKNVEPDQFKKKRKSKEKSKKSKSKVREVQPEEIRKKHKTKGRSKKSKPKNHKSPKTDLKQAETVSSNAAPNHRVREGEFDEEATIDKSAEQAQVVHKSKHKSTTESQPSKVLHSSLVKIAEYVKLAHEAAGRTASTVHTQHIRKSINSGICTALNEVQMSGTVQAEQAIEQKLRDKVLECIDGKSPYTTSRQVLVTLNNFIQSLQIRVIAAQQSDDEVKKEEKQGQHKDCELRPGQMHCTRPQDRPGQSRKSTTFSRDIILIIWRRRILVHLRAMSKEDFLGVVESSFRMVSPQVDASRALSWLSHATITDSGNVKVSIHTKDSKELETVTEDMVTAWARVLQNEVEQSNKVFEVLVPNFPAEPINIADPGRKAETIEQLVRTNAATISSLTKPNDIRDIKMAKVNGQASWAIAVVIVFSVCELANNVIENGLDWNGEHYKCEALGASELLERCQRCQLYTHRANSCTNTLRCGKCCEPHLTKVCKSTNFKCAVCSGPHRASSEACPARNAAREEIQMIRFAPDSEEDYPQLITSRTYHGKNLCKAPGLQGMAGAKFTGPHPNSREVLENLRRLRGEVVAFEEELTARVESRDRCSVSVDVPGEKARRRRDISGEAQEAIAIAGLSAARNGKGKARKRKATETTTNDNHSEVEFNQKRIKREDSAFDQFGYQWTPGYYGPRV